MDHSGKSKTTKVKITPIELKKGFDSTTISQHIPLELLYPSLLFCSCSCSSSGQFLLSLDALINTKRRPRTSKYHPKWNSLVTGSRGLTLQKTKSISPQPQAAATSFSFSLPLSAPNALHRPFSAPPGASLWTGPPPAFERKPRGPKPEVSGYRKNGSLELKRNG